MIAFNLSVSLRTPPHESQSHPNWSRIPHLERETQIIGHRFFFFLSVHHKETFYSPLHSCLLLPSLPPLLATLSTLPHNDLHHKGKAEELLIAKNTTPFLWHNKAVATHASHDPDLKAPLQPPYAFRHQWQQLDIWIWTWCMPKSVFTIEILFFNTLSGHQLRCCCLQQAQSDQTKPPTLEVRANEKSTQTPGKAALM